MTPAVRFTLLTVVEGERAFTDHKGWYLEDIVALFFYREFSQKLATPVFFDAARGGADFILAFPDRKIPIEIGYGKKKGGSSTLGALVGKTCRQIPAHPGV